MEYLTMDVKIIENNKGQSLFEFILLLPVLLGFSTILIRINTAIQISIVNQQFTRDQLGILINNSAFYPALSKQQILIQTGSNQMVLGVSENQAVADDNGTYSPEATTQWVGRGSASKSNDSPQEEPSIRGSVRIRNSITICTNSFLLPTNITSLMLDSSFHAANNVQLTESHQVAYCAPGGMSYEQ